MDKKRITRKAIKSSSPPASRTRSKSPARVTKSRPDSVALKRRPKKTDTPSEEVSSSSQSSTPIKQANINKAINILDDSGDNDEVAEITTRTTRLASLRKRLTPVNYKITTTPSDIGKRSISRSVSSLTKEESDNEDDDEEEDFNDDVEMVPLKVAGYQDLGLFSKPLINFLLLEVLLFVPIVLQLCFKHNGKWDWPIIIEELKTSSTYCNKQAGSFFLAFLSGTVILSLIPIGRFVRLYGSNETYRFNGFLAAFVILAFLLGLEYRGLDSLTAIYNNIDQFFYLNIIANICIASSIYLKGKFWPSANSRNPYAKSGRFIIDFAAGLEINPRVYDKFDAKLIAYHRSIILILIINVALLFKNVTLPVVETTHDAEPINDLIKHTYESFVFIVQNSEYNIAALIISSLLVLYALDILIFEHHLAASFQINDEGFGAEMLLRFATFPFLLSFLPRFLLNEKLDINNYVLTGITIAFIFGLIIKRSSSKLKYEYRLRPNDTRFRGKKIHTN